MNGENGRLLRLLLLLLEIVVGKDGDEAPRESLEVLVLQDDVDDAIVELFLRATSGSEGSLQPVAPLELVDDVNKADIINDGC